MRQRTEPVKLGHYPLFHPTTEGERNANRQGTVSGVVTDDTTSAALSGAQPNFEGEETGVKFSAASDGNGAFEVQSVPAGVYLFEVLVSGYVSKYDVTVSSPTITGG
jgi:Carboxypeptidase regulatory-like domain